MMCWMLLVPLITQLYVRVAWTSLLFCGMSPQAKYSGSTGHMLVGVILGLSHSFIHKIHSGEQGTP